MTAATMVARGLHGTQDAALKAFAAAHLPGVESALAQAVVGLGVPGPAYDAAVRDAVDVGGGQAHRWRPLVILAATDACGARPSSALEVAVAVELTHTASLVLDDLPCMDNAPLRRGRPATHSQVGTSGAILIAIGLLGRAVELIGRAPSGAGELARGWGDAVGLAGMAGGQVMDLRERAGESLAGRPRRLYRRKTTALAAFAARAGGIVASASSEALDALTRFGDHLGWAYQLRDDVADIEEDGAGSRLLALEQAAVRRARLVGRAERSLQQVTWVRPASAEALAAAARRIAGVPAAALRER
jgi:geranylgeranyl diphosphate synthase type II